MLCGKSDFFYRFRQCCNKVVVLFVIVISAVVIMYILVLELYMYLVSKGIIVTEILRNEN